MEEILSSLIGGNGIALQVVSIVGLLRLVVKPLMEIVKAYVEFTPNKKDDSLVNHVIQSPLYNKFLFVIDWLTSIKIKK